MQCLYRQFWSPTKQNNWLSTKIYRVLDVNRWFSFISTSEDVNNPMHFCKQPVTAMITKHLWKKWKEIGSYYVTLTSGHAVSDAFLDFFLGLVVPINHDQIVLHFDDCVLQFTALELPYLQITRLSQWLWQMPMEKLNFLQKVDLRIVLPM